MGNRFKPAQQSKSSEYNRNPHSNEKKKIPNNRKTGAQSPRNTAYLKVYLWVLSFLGTYKREFSIFLATSIIVALIELSVPKFIQHFIDHIVPSKAMNNFTSILLILLGMIVIMFVAMAIRNFLQRTIQEKAARDLQFTLFSHLRKLGFSYYERNPIGETLSLFNTEITAVQQIYHRYFPEIIEKAFVLLITTVLMLSINIKMFFIIVPCFLSYYTIGPYFERKAMEWLKVTRANRVVSNKKIYNSIASLIEVRTMNRHHWDMGKLLQRLKTFHDSNLKANLFAFLRGTVRRLTVYFGALVFFIVSAFSIKSGSLSIGEFVAFTFYYYRIMTDLTVIVTLITEQKMVLLQAERLYNFMQEKPDVLEHQTSRVLEKVTGDIKIKDVSFSYDKKKPLLQGINIHIKAGERIALVGHSGNGKTTLLKLIGRFYDPDHGHILLDDVPMQDLSLAEIRDAFGYVFQETYLFGFSVMENIRFGQPQASDQEVIAAAQAANAHEFIMKLPNGYNTLLGERGVKLSGGQKQRIAIARMFIKNPSVLLLDEATSALDNENEIEVTRALDKLLKNRTTIAVAHRLSSVRHYDRIILLEHGTNIEEGSYEELIHKKGKFYQLAVGD